MTDRKLLCIYPHDSFSGFAAVWAVHRRFGDGVEFVAAKYGELPPMDKINPSGAPYTRDVLIVDFSYPRAVLETIARQARSVLVLDHHKTAAEQLAGLPMPKFLIGKGEDTWDNWLNAKLPDGMVQLAAIFDMERSGAGLTYDYLFGQVGPHGIQPPPRPRLIDLVEDRDLWRFRLDPDTRRFHAVASSFGYEATAENFARWDKWHRWTHYLNPPGKITEGIEQVYTEKWEDLLNEGVAIIRAQARMVDSILASTRRTMRIAGHVVPVACCPGALASEVGNRLCVDMPITGPMAVDDTLLPSDARAVAAGKMDRGRSYREGLFSATYYDGADGRRHFSFRSPEGGADVGAIAQRYGGGGHAHAAGFTVPIGHADLPEIEP